jgi:hypothetical protein
MTDEHRGGFLNVVAACMEKRIERELWTIGEIIPLFAPQNFILGPDPSTKFWIEADADGGLLVEGLQVTVEAIVAQQ